MIELVMTLEDHPVVVAARVVNILIKNIQTGTEIGIGIWTVKKTEIGNVIGIGKEIGNVIGIWTVKEIERGTVIGRGNVKEIGTGTLTEIGVETGTESENMIMIVGPGILREKAEGTMKGVVVKEVGTIEKAALAEVTAEAGVAAEAEAEVCKLVWHHLIVFLVHIRM